MNGNQQLYLIALTLIPGIGTHLTRSLIQACGTPEEVFRSPRRILERIPGIGRERASWLLEKDLLKRAEKELVFIEKHSIEVIPIGDPRYPKLLQTCSDAPFLLYFRGSMDHWPEKNLSIVGTRKATDQGKAITQEIVEDVRPYEPLIISGLAYGIDAAAHRAALTEGLPTLAVVGHGHDRIYPAAHRGLAEKIMENGGILSEYPSGTIPDGGHFPARNRIVAGLANAVIVVEAAQKGGALITAEIANSYNREVFAVPGRIHDPFSEGCLDLIRTHRANLYQSARDLEYVLDWKPEEMPGATQTQLFIHLSEDEKAIMNVLNEKGKMEVDLLGYEAGLSISKLSGTLMNLELNGMVKSYPGKVFGPC